MSMWGIDDEQRQDLLDHKKEILNDLTTLRLSVVKGRVTRLLKEIDDFSAQQKQFNLEWYPTYSHVSLEAYYEHRHLIQDGAYVAKIETAYRKYEHDERWYIFRNTAMPLLRKLRCLKT